MTTVARKMSIAKILCRQWQVKYTNVELGWTDSARVQAK